MHSLILVKSEFFNVVQLVPFDIVQESDCGHYLRERVPVLCHHFVLIAESTDITERSNV